MQLKRRLQQHANLQPQLQMLLHRIFFQIF